MIRVQAFRREELIGDEVSAAPACFLGKDEGSLIALQGWRIGRRQLQFSLNDEGLHVKDGGGMSPVKINGNSVNSYGPLASTDIIELSDYKVRVHLTEEAYEYLAKLSAKPDAAANESRVEDPPARISDNPLEQPDGIALRGRLHKKLISAMDLRRVTGS